ncbi:hypothetical protein AB3Y40_11260 [Yoonia sp. R2331]|uniref:hypothetical protein n=1 Tax=Yoonia sp. R2331 TaxID=3237238 RepID=UPI0034E4C21E
MTLTTAPLPDDAFLHRYAERDDCYADCYMTDAQAPDLATCIRAFYTTPLFRAERLILGVVGMSSTDADVDALAAGTADTFAAWRVEDRADHQILLSDKRGYTRSWLYHQPGCLFFGSAVTPPEPDAPLGVMVNALMPFHKVYSRGLLGSAARRLA